MFLFNLKYVLNDTIETEYKVLGRTYYAKHWRSYLACAGSYQSHALELVYFSYSCCFPRWLHVEGLEMEVLLDDHPRLQLYALKLMVHLMMSYHQMLLMVNTLKFCIY